MFCMKCGAENEQGNRFCQKCGFALEQDEVNAETVVTEIEEVEENEVAEVPFESVKPPKDEKKSSAGTQILVWGIVSLVAALVPYFFMWPLMLPLGILGLIFSCITKKKIKKFNKQYDTTIGKVKAGSILSTIALVIDWINIVIGVVLAIIWVVLTVVSGVGTALSWLLAGLGAIGSVLATALPYLAGIITAIGSLVAIILKFIA